MLVAGLLALLVGALAVASVSPAHAQEAVTVDLLDADLDADGATRLTVALAGEVGDDPLPAESFTVVESGEEITDVEVEPLTEEGEREPATVMVLVDVSASTAGDPIEAAQAAAGDLVAELVDEGVDIGLVAFHTDAELLVAPGDDLGALTSEIADLEPGGNTALYDAVVLGAEQLEGVEGQRSLVLFTDGADTTSDADLEEAVAAATAAGAPITNVALLTEDQDPDVLVALSDETEGRLLEVADSGDLGDAFVEVGQSFTNQYRLSYHGTELASELDLQLVVEVNGATGAHEGVVINQRAAGQQSDGQQSNEATTPSDEATATPLPTRTPQDLGWLATTSALYTGVAAAFVTLALLLALLFVPTGERAVSIALRRGVTTVPSGERHTASSSGGSAAARLGRRVVELVSRLPRPEGYDERSQTDIDRAGWRLRASELNAIRAGAALAGLLGLWAISGSWLLGALGLAAGAFAPLLLLANHRQRRQTRFVEQLPETLQLLAGTLRAGYGLLQGIDTIVKETSDPMSAEFQRVLTEARLGLPLEDSLDAMADRIQSEDFRWVVVAINIQRQVGGNLAELLETVSETMRGREQVQRQIRTLSAEGRLSAIVLIALPFVILAYMLMVNPAYLLTMFTHPLGLAMVGGAGLLMVFGVFWIRHMIRIDV